METNRVPYYDDRDNPTGCCPRFNPEGWDGQRLHFHDKPFVRATTRSLMHFPLNMGRVFDRVGTHMGKAGVGGPEDMIVLSRDLSPWRAEHLFSAPRSVPEEEMVTLSGDFVTKVFEGPFRQTAAWIEILRSEALARGETPRGTYLFYTTCPRCAKVYGHNYVVGVQGVEA